MKLRHESLALRRAMLAGVKHGPEAFVRYSPPVFGCIFAAALKRQRRSVLDVLRRIHGKRNSIDEMRDVAAVFSTFACSMTDGILCGSDRSFRAVNRPINEWYFHSSLAKKKGVIMATASTAGWDVANLLNDASPETDVLVVMRREANQRARELHDKRRIGAGMRFVHVGDDPLDSLPLLRHLRKGGVVALKIDHSVPGMRKRSVRFLGGAWEIPEGPLRLSALSGAPIIPVFTHRLGFLEYQSINAVPIIVSRRPSVEELDSAAQHLADSLETFVRAHPHHWFRFQPLPT